MTWTCRSTTNVFDNDMTVNGADHDNDDDNDTTQLPTTTTTTIYNDNDSFNCNYEDFFVPEKCYEKNVKETIVPTI